MFLSKLPRIVLPLLILAAGVWLVGLSANPAPETASRQEAIQAFAPASNGIVETGDLAVPTTQIAEPVSINLRDVPAGVLDPNNQLHRWERGEIDLVEQDGILGAAQVAKLQAEAAELLPSLAIQEPTGPNPLTPALGVNFDSMDYNECCGGGGNVPPDPELTVGPNHIIAVVNVALEIYDKSGNSLVGPTTFDSFMSANPSCTGVFDPNAIYDESADRYILGIDADGTGYCMAVSQTGDPTGSWNIYHYVTGSASLFFDYPHAGVGRDAIYMGANMFTFSFLDSRVWAFDKQAMYAGLPAASVMRNLGSNEDTPQPMNLHGWNQGTWPTSGPHYILTETGYNGASHTIWAWNDPFGANTLTAVGTFDLNATTGVTAGLPINSVQSGSGGTLNAGDWRPLDFEYRNGFGWTTMTIACNPGSGTVNCIRWAQINPATATVVQSGVLASNGEYRFHPDLAVNHCNDMAVGYTKSSSSTFPSVYYAGRQGSDPANTLQAETLIKAGEITYTSFESSSPRRWGDYTGMTIDPNGTTFWYLGEYSKNTGTTQGRWGTYIASMSYPTCNPGGGPTPTPTSTGVPPTPTHTPVPPTPTATPGTGDGSVTLNPVADVFAIVSRPSGNLGGAATLRLDASPETNSYLRFNVTGVAGSVTQATLRLYTQSSSSAGYNVHQVADNSWGEFTLNGSNAPALGSIINSAGAITANSYVDVPVTGYITGNGLFSFGLSTAETSLIQLSSREGSNPPELIVQFGSGGGPTPTPTSTPVPPTPTPGPGGSTFTFAAGDDAIVLANRPAANYGSLTTLGTDDVPDIRSYLKFTVAGLDGPVSSATLRLFVNSGNAPFNVAQVASSSWAEGSITYSNAPSAGAIINGSGPVSSGWLEIDVTSYIGGSGTFSLALLPAGVDRNLFSSAEGTNAPELVVVTGP